MTDNIQILKHKLNSFVNKYYVNLIVKGIIVVPIIFFTILFLVSWLEYINWFSINTRLFIFLFGIATIFFFVATFLFIPILKFFNIAKRLSDKDAAKIISNYFPEIQDKIINTLELHTNFSDKNELIIASINQKTNQLKKFNFNNAVNFKSNLKIVRYLLIALFIFLISIFIKPEIYTKGTKRIVSFNKEFVKDAGFKIIIDTSSLFVNRSDDLEINIKLIGEKLPAELFINYGGLDFLLEKISNSHYKYKFKNVNSNFYFKIYNQQFKSKNYEVKVLLKPILKNYKLKLIYPKYINKPDETINNINEINIPYGSKLEWEFFTQFCDTIFINKKDTILTYLVNDNTLKINDIALKSYIFSVSLSNKNTLLESLISIKINVIPDLYPSIKVNYVKDKTNYRLFYFKGIITDDFGFSKLQVHKNNKEPEAIKYLKNLREQEFYYAYEFSKNASEIEIYFKVFDNDFIGGPKSAKSDIVKITLPKAIEIDNKQKEDFKQLSEKLDKSLLMAYELERDIQEIKKSLINDNLQNWEKQKQIENLIDKHNKLNKIVNEIAQKNLEKDNFKNSFSETAEEILDKQKQIQDLLENVMSDEIKKMLDELKKLSEQYDEDKLNELSKKMEINYDDLSKELDKNLELLKKFEIEERINTQIENIKKLSDKQNNFSKNLNDKKNSTDSLKQENRKTAEELGRIKDEYKQNVEKNKELENSMDLQNFDESFDEIQKNILDNEQNINKKDNKKSTEKAKQNADALNQLAKNMRQMMNKNKKEEAGENADALRLLLNNLFFISFNQEQVMVQFLYTKYDNPKYMELMQEQKKLTDDFKIARDSLYALSKRTPLIGKHISKAAFTIENEMINTLTYIEKRNIGIARRKQQEVLTATNDMILLLSESLEKMDGMSGGSGSSSNKRKRKPKKGGKESLSDMKKGQESFKKQLESMLNKMKQGKAQGKGAMGKMLAQQEILQQMLNELLSNGSVGKKATKQLNDIKKLMEINKRDLVNMKISESTFFRQKQIMTRLLEAEDAENERDKDNKRESKQVINYKLSNPKKLFENNKENINFNEIFNTKSVNLFDFYKYKYMQYLNNIEK